MDVSADRRRLLAAIANGVPLGPRPFAEVASHAGITEADTIAVLRAMVDAGTITRFGLILDHRALGYQANAMVVFDVDDAHAAEIGRRMAEFPFVALCYRRSRHPPDWPYNLYVMIHGREREIVREQIDELTRASGLGGAPREILFTVRRFKQTGARYAAARGAA